MNGHGRTAYRFRASSGCQYNDKLRTCVEVAVNVDGVVAVRDSKTGQVQEYSLDEWRIFLAGAKAGEFDV